MFFNNFEDGPVGKGIVVVAIYQMYIAKWLCISSGDSYKLYTDAKKFCGYCDFVVLQVRSYTIHELLCMKSYFIIKYSSTVLNTIKL